jgi:hypothetical protein
LADPHILYMVLGADVVALVLWVAFVLLRMPVALPAQSPAPTATEAPQGESKEGKEAPHSDASKADRPKLSSHSDIRDEPGSSGSDASKAERG